MVRTSKYYVYDSFFYGVYNKIKIISHWYARGRHEKLFYAAKCNEHTLLIDYWTNIVHIFNIVSINMTCDDLSTQIRNFNFHHLVSLGTIFLVLLVPARMSLWSFCDHIEITYLFAERYMNWFIEINTLIIILTILFRIIWLIFILARTSHLCKSIKMFRDHKNNENYRKRKKSSPSTDRLILIQTTYLNS